MDRAALSIIGMLGRVLVIRSCLYHHNVVRVYRMSGKAKKRRNREIGSGT